ncbi:cation diffusion facilitator family transporter [Oxalobacteraceae bacterium R-40]|uniref:Cation diffusion facilitator family transporter n=1 Tax=Keguizhuia sedimenti TaxID=3064264 RepID=A0ABU1BTU5_9BURK|nr:cation diffusion facilitator family transporter [Oxalobacteraceae bacterium R-40]
MSACCSGGCSTDKPPVDAKYRRILWIALLVNASMFGIELLGGWKVGSVSLLADAVDFFGDATNYGVSLFVLGLAPIWRSRTALVKGLTMGGYGLFVLGAAAWNLAAGTIPKASTMGTIGFLALAANLFVGILLFAYRNGDSNMRSVWLCTRNDAIGNVAVLLAALGVFGTGAGWPDILVATVMGVLGLTAARTVTTQARAEMKQDAAPTGLSAQPASHKTRIHESH